MLVRLHAQRGIERLAYRLVGVAAATCGFDIDLLIAKQARTDLAVGREAQAVALATKMVAHRRDKSHRALGAGELPVLGRATAAGRVLLGNFLQGRQALLRCALVDDVAQLGAVDHIVARPASAVDAGVFSHRHVLDKTHMQRAVDGHLGKLQKILVEALYRNGVDLDRLKTHLERRVDCRKDVFYVAQACNAVVGICIKRVEADVDAREARVFEVLRHTRQKQAVGGKADVVYACGLDICDEAHDTLLDQRLSAGQAHLLDALLRGDLGHFGNLFYTQHAIVRFPGHAFWRHAVNAAQIAAIRDADAQVVDLSAQMVFQSGNPPPSQSKR